MKLQYFFGCIIAAASLAAWPENDLSCAIGINEARLLPGTD